MVKLTFKNYPKPTGLSRIGSGEPGADIKLKGKVIGFISPSNRYRKYCLAFFKIKKNPTYEEPSPFENKHLTFSTKTVDEMKIYLRENSEKIVNELDLYISED